MLNRSLTPSITVTIGRHTRLYFAFVTTAPADLDSPATVTLHTDAFSEVAGFAAEPVTHDQSRGRMPARLILIDATELAWQRAKTRGHEHLLLPADPYSWASTRCSTGCGNGSRHPRSGRRSHESRNPLVRVNSSPKWRISQEVTS
jgi:hypothetical protein